jgi:allantoin racemase
MVKVAFVIGDYPSEERTRRENVALSYSTADIQVGIVSAPVTPYFHGMTSTEINIVNPAIIQAFVDAEKQGYDAAVPLGFLDLGIDGGRSAVDIPVIGPFEAALHIASFVGDRFGVIVYHESQIPWMEQSARRLRMDDRIVAYGNSGFDLPDIINNKDAMIENFIATARKMIEDDRVDVILPAGITQCPVHMNPQWLMEQIGVPVVEGIGGPIRIAALLASSGLRHSRKRWWKSSFFAPK